MGANIDMENKEIREVWAEHLLYVRLLGLFLHRTFMNIAVMNQQPPTIAIVIIGGRAARCYLISGGL